MRKLAKIFAIVMIACLLCGIIAVSVLATDTGAESFLDVSNADKGITTQKYQDFEGVEITNTGTPSDPTYDIAVMNGTDRIITGYQGSAYGNIWEDVTPSSGVGVDGKYLKLTSTTTASTSVKRCLILDTTNFNVTMTGTKVTAGQTFQDDGPAGTLRMMTVDFDICATDYVFELTKTGETTKTKFFVSEIKEDAAGRYIVLDEEVVGSTAIEGETGKYRYPVTDTTNYTLSYGTTTIENYFHYFDTSYTYKSAIAATSGIPNGMKISKNTSDNKWYISYEDGGTAVALAEKAGVWNHITVLYYSLENQESKDSDTKVTLYASYFLNGTYLGSSNKTFGTANLYLSPTNVRLEFAANVLATYDPSMGIDNVAVTAYTITENENTALATNDGTLYGFCKSGDCEKTTPTKPLNELTDVVYNKDTYLSPNELHTIKINNGAPVRYATQAKLLEALKADSDTVTLEVHSSSDILDYTPDETIDNIDKLIIYAPSVTLSEAAKSRGYVCNAVIGESGKWVVGIAEDVLWVQFCDENGNPIEEIENASLAPLQDPKSILPEGYDEIIEEGGNYYCYTLQHISRLSDNYGSYVRLEAMDKATMDLYTLDYKQESPMPVKLVKIEDDTITRIIWRAPNGDEFKRALLSVGDPIPAHPTPEEMKGDERFLAKTGNGWYDKCYTSWKLESGSATEAVAGGSVFVVDTNTFEPIPNVEGIQYNLTLTGDSTPVIYAPVIFNSANIENGSSGKTTMGKTIPSEIEYLGFVDSNGNPLADGETVTPKFKRIGGVLLNYDTAAELPANAMTDSTKYIGFKIDGYDGVFIQTITIGFEKYANAVLTSYECGSEESVLVLAALNFINNNSILSSGSEQTKATAILNAHAEGCKCTEAGRALYSHIATAPDNSKYAELKAAGVHSAAFSFTINQPCMIINIPEDELHIPGGATSDGNKISTVVIKYYGVNVSGNVYDPDALNHLHTTTISVPTTIGTDSSSYIYRTANTDSDGNALIAFRLKNIGMCNADANFTIELYNTENVLLGSGTYSITDYIDYQSKALADAKANANAVAEQVATKALNAAKGLYFFAEAARDYKIWSGTETRPNVTVNFDSDGGSEVAPITVQLGKKITTLPVPTKDGCIFEGWFYEVDTETRELTDDTVIRETIFATARWKINAVLYDDFGAVGDGVTNDYAAIYNAHVYANEHNLPVAATAGKVYYLESPIVNGQILTIPIRTDVNWHGAEFIIDDTNITPTTSYRESYVFRIETDYEVVTITDTDFLNTLVGTGLDETTTSLDITAALGEEYENNPYPVLITLYNANHRIYRRKGYSGYAGASMSEVVVLDKDGNIDTETALMWDYHDLTKIEVRRCDDKEITVENGVFTTRAPQYNALDADRKYTGKSINRGLHVRRSNTLIKNVEHFVTGEKPFSDQINPETKEIEFVGMPYYGFYRVGYCTDVTLEDCVITGRRLYVRPNGVNPGTYDLTVGYANRTVFKNCTQSNFWVTVDEEGNIHPATEGDEGAVLGLGSFPEKIKLDSGSVVGTSMHWGCGGSNFAKNMQYIGCTLSRYDAHDGMCNGKVIDSTVQTIAILGAGEMIIENTRIFPDEGNPRVFGVRKDYGGTFDGTVKIDNVSVIAPTSSNYFIMEREYYKNWYYGYYVVIPNLEINDVIFYDCDSYNPATNKYTPVAAGTKVYLYCKTIVHVQTMFHLPELYVNPASIAAQYPIYSVEDKDEDGYIDVPDYDGDGVWGNTEWLYSEKKAELGSDYIDGYQPIPSPKPTEFTTVLNLNRVTPPEYVKILGNAGGYKYLARDTSLAHPHLPGNVHIESGGYHGVAENYKGFYGSTKFYYGSGENDFYQGPPTAEEKIPSENIYEFFPE